MDLDEGRSQLALTAQQPLALQFDGLVSAFIDIYDIIYIYMYA
jgi:hypothetical protein